MLHTCIRMRKYEEMVAWSCKYKYSSMSSQWMWWPHLWFISGGVLSQGLLSGLRKISCAKSPHPFKLHEATQLSLPEIKYEADRQGLQSERKDTAKQFRILPLGLPNRKGLSTTQVSSWVCKFWQVGQFQKFNMLEMGATQHKTVTTFTDSGCFFLFCVFLFLFAWFCL